MIENSQTEFKREYTPDIKKEVIAFANGGGGTIFVGVDDNGGQYPLADPDGTLTQITNSIRDSISPDITMFVSYENDENVISIHVQEGTNKPYFLSEKGLKPSGVYVRQGASSAPASFEQIREMIKLTDGDKFETTRSMVQDLTFQEAEDEFLRCGLAFEENQKRTLGIIATDGLYTNLGLLLSDQCTHTIKVAVFNGSKKGEFKTRKEFGGSLLKQMHGAFDFLSLSNNLSASFVGLNRIEHFDYPEEIMREAILNAIIHRDYSFSGSIIINIYDDRMEFVSLGGLVQGLQIEDLFLGVSQPRNEKLANIFYRMRYIEAYGTGIKRITGAYEAFEEKPDITATHGGFVLTLPNMNRAHPLKAQVLPKSQHTAILEYIKENGSINNEAVQELLSVKQTRAYTIIREMVEAGAIVKRSADRDETEYVLADK